MLIACSLKGLVESSLVKLQSAYDKGFALFSVLFLFSSNHLTITVPNNNKKHPQTLISQSSHFVWQIQMLSTWKATRGMLKTSMLWLLVWRKWATAHRFHYSSTHWPYTYSRFRTTVPYTLVIHSNQCAIMQSLRCAEKAVDGISTLLGEHRTLKPYNVNVKAMVHQNSVIYSLVFFGTLKKIF